jgi:hypothetical protein
MQRPPSSTHIQWRLWRLWRPEKTKSYFPHYSLMQPPAASMEAHVKEFPMLILKILLKWPIIAKFSIGLWIAASSSLHGVWE